MDPKVKTGLMAVGIVGMLALGGGILLLLILAGSPVTPTGNGHGKPPKSTDDQLALQYLEQAKFEKTNAPQSDKRYMTVMLLGSCVGDYKTSPPIRAEIISFLKTLTSDPDPDVRKEVEKALRNAPQR